jgi:hypothetical protein
MQTPYDKDRQEFSDKGHLKAQSMVYPDLFQVKRDQLDFTVIDDEEQKKQDYTYGIDRTVKVEVARLKDKLSFTAQERFRHPKFIDYQDVTITEWNNNSNLPSELYKIHADLFVYGYYDLATNSLIEAIVFPVLLFKIRLAQGKIGYKRGMNNKNQSFITVTFETLKKADLVIFHNRWGFP